MLDLETNCSSEGSIENLIRVLEVYMNAKNLSTKLIPALISYSGSPKNRFAYWKEHVEKNCIPRTCPRLEEIRRSVIRFPPNSDRCIC